MQVMRNDEVDVVDIVADVVEVIAAHVAVCAARSTAVRDPNSSDAFWLQLPCPSSGVTLPGRRRRLGMQAPRAENFARESGNAHTPRYQRRICKNTKAIMICLSICAGRRTSH